MAKYRSKFEKTIAKLSDKRIKHEPFQIKYVLEKMYTPDFELPNGILIEAKGNFRSASERTKMLHIKKQNPKYDIRFLFQNPNLKISKSSKTTYAKWAEKNGFKWASGAHIPQEWVEEKITKCNIIIGQI